MHARIAALANRLSSPWWGLRAWRTRRAGRKQKAMVAVVDDARPNRSGAHRNLESEMIMADVHQQNTGRPDEAAVAAESEEDIEAALKSMQGELEGLSGLLEQDGNTAPSRHAPQEVVPQTRNPQPSDSAAGMLAASAAADLQALLENVDDEAASGSAPIAEIQAARVSGVKSVAPSDKETQAPGTAGKQPGVAPSPASTPAPPSPQSAPRSPTGFATAAQQAFTTPWPQPQSPSVGRAQQRTRSRRAQGGPVESAILNLATFLEDEVAGLWEGARTALAEITHYRDQMQQSAQRIETLEREICDLRDDMAGARREARTVQKQVQNLRDDTARARQRADSAALDAQAAADRAISAAREIDLTPGIRRDVRELD